MGIQIRISNEAHAVLIGLQFERAMAGSEKVSNQALVDAAIFKAYPKSEHPDCYRWQKCETEVKAKK